jgi:hypothetical protein
MVTLNFTLIDKQGAPTTLQIETEKPDEMLLQFLRERIIAGARFGLPIVAAFVYNNETRDMRQFVVRNGAYSPLDFGLVEQLEFKL